MCAALNVAGLTVATANLCCCHKIRGRIMERELARSFAKTALVSSLVFAASPAWALDEVTGKEAEDETGLSREVRTQNEMDWAKQIQINYPSAALREELQGTVGVRVQVNPEGSVETCEVTSSSEHTILDEAACSGMVNFAQFHPALDSEGDPTVGTYTTRITYSLGPTTTISRKEVSRILTIPEAKDLNVWAERIREGFPSEYLQQNKPSIAVLSLSVDQNGKASSCDVFLSKGSNEFLAEVCTRLLNHAQFQEQTDSGSPSVRNRNVPISVYAVYGSPPELTVEIMELSISRFTG